MDNYARKAMSLDEEDTLRDFRDQFVNDTDLIYLDGNSLGKLPKRAVDISARMVEEEWGGRLIRGWNEGWMELPRRIAAKIGGIVGAQEDEIFVGDSTTVNLYKLAFASLAFQSGKDKVISDELNFPADLYVLQGLIEHQFNDHTLKLLRSKDGITISGDKLRELMDKNTALLVLSHVAFKSSFMYNMEQVNRTAHDKGALVIWDLSHAAGAVPVELNKTDSDMAVGCTYKYLNGGPGAPAFLYVRRDLQGKLVNPVTSWFGHSRPFDFELEYDPASSVQKFAAGTPAVLSMAAIEPGLDLVLEAGIERIRNKSVRQSQFIIELINDILPGHGFRLASPSDSRQRGSHVSVQHGEAYRISRAMIEPSDNSRIVIPDFRPPDNIRLGISPLYTSFADIHYSVSRIARIVENREYERFGSEKPWVT